MLAEHDLIRIKREGLRGVIEELLGGHDDVRADLPVLRDLLGAASPAAQQGWLTALATATRVLADKLAVHFQNEEELVFPLAPQLLDEATLARIMTEMAALGTSQQE